jgi:hypothetical protein
MRPADNPFRTERLDALRYRFVDGSREALLARLAAQGFRGALVGPEGSGKSTLLRELAAELRRRGFRTREVQLREDEPGIPWDRLRGLGPGDALLLDGAEQIGWMDRLRVRRAARGAGAFLVTAHAETWLPALHRTRTTPGLLASLAAELAPGVEVGGLWGRHGGDVREALLALYDRNAGILPAAPSLGYAKLVQRET